MPGNTRPEVWLRGPVANVPALLMPAAHCLLQCREEIAAAAAPLAVGQLWARPGGAASAGFHLQHIAGSLDRLLSYARGEQLTPAQFAALGAEGVAGSPPAEASVLIADAEAAIDGALATIRATPEADLLLPRAVGRAGLPSNVLGLLFHAAEHTHRHTGQLVTTAKIVRATQA